MPPRLSTSLWLRLVLTFLLLVTAGSLALVLWLEAAARRDSRRDFAALARTNAELIHSARLPATERTAGYLSRILNLRVFFRREAEPAIVPRTELALDAVPPGRGVVRLAGNLEAVSVAIDPGESLVLVRVAEPRWALLRPGETLPLLGVFGLLSVALAWERARRAQAERLALLGRMATGLAHEIHNPLAAIRMHAQLLESTPAAELPRTAADSLPVLIGETARIEGLVQQWMFLARPQPPQKSRTDLATLVAGVARALGPQAAHAEVRIVEEVPAGLAVEVDARRIAQAIGNVALNAIQAMPGGGTLTIRGEAHDGVRLVFCDTGRGFSPAALARHAELFFTEKEGGMGIGLSVAAEILKAHGGVLHVANAVEGGAVVTMEFAGGRAVGLGTIRVPRVGRGVPPRRTFLQ